MTITVGATYENGVLKPDQPLPLGECEKVRVTVEGLHETPQTAPLNLGSLFDTIEAEVGLFDGPSDQAAQLDHYLYGAPKTKSHGG